MSLDEGWLAYEYYIVREMAGLRDGQESGVRGRGDDLLSSWDILWKVYIVDLPRLCRGSFQLKPSHHHAMTQVSKSGS